MNHAQATRARLSVGVVRLLLALGTAALVLVASCLAALQADRGLRADLLEQARMVAAGLAPQRLLGLTATGDDLAAADYQRLKQQVTLIRAANPKCRFLYLMRRRADGAVVLLVDSEPPESQDYSPPGQIYVEAPRELHDVFATRHAAVRGPYQDRWGTWISAFVPLPGTADVLSAAVLGMDVSATGWRRAVIARAALPAALAAVAVLLGLLATVLYLSRRAAREREDELEALLRRMISAFVVFDSVFDERGEFVSCRFAYVNDAYERITGAKRDEVLGRTLHDVWPGTEPAWLQAYGEVAMTGVAREFDMFHGPAGRLHHCSVYRPGASRNRFCVIFEDITESRRLEDAVLRERGNLQAVLDASPVGMLVFNEHEDVLLVNPAAEAMFGKSERTLAARRCGDILRCVNRDAAPGGCGTSVHCPACKLAAATRAALAGDAPAAALQGETMVTIEGRGAPTWLSFKVATALVRGERWVVMALDDITERKRAEEQIRALLAESDQARAALLGILEDETRAEAERRRLATALEQAAEAIMVTDAQGLIQYVNPAFESITGYTREEALGQNPRMLKSGRQDDAFYRELWETISSGRTWKGRFVNTRKDGAHFTEDATISPVRDASGAIMSYVAVKRDLTEQLRLQSQLLQAQKLESVGTLAGGVAHEINNPIMGIMNYAQLIKDTAVPGVQTIEFADEIIHETERVAKIVRNLLQFARQEEEMLPRLARLSDIVDDTLSLIRTVMRHDQIALVARVPQDLPQIRCRSRQIQQVIMSLLTNARDTLNEKYAGHDENKKLTITASASDRDGCRWVRLTIEDRGEGIPEDLRERIFEPFFSSKPRDRGTGLGLSISYGIVTDHGGQLSVESQVGEWTRFHIDLPACPGSDAGA